MCRLYRRVLRPSTNPDGSPPAGRSVRRENAMRYFFPPVLAAVCSLHGQAQKEVQPSSPFVFRDVIEEVGLWPDGCFENPDDFIANDLVVLYGRGSFIERNETYEVRQHCPGFVTIGDDSGGMQFILPLRRRTGSDGRHRGDAAGVRRTGGRRVLRVARRRLSVTRGRGKPAGRAPDPRLH